MKAVLDKAMNVLSGYTRGNPRGEDPMERTTELVQQFPQSQAVVVNQDVHSPFQAAISTLSNTVEGDGVLFSKNNVLLKHPCADISEVEPGQEASPHQLGTVQPINSLDNHVLVPGFLFVTTRGSNFGTTLILNWAPNSSMKTPRPSAYSPTTKTGNEGYSSISIDLCLMEIIRIFYHMDHSGFIVSGELVVKSKEENFQVCPFRSM